MASLDKNSDRFSLIDEDELIITGNLDLKINSEHRRSSIWSNGQNELGISQPSDNNPVPITVASFDEKEPSFTTMNAFRKERRIASSNLDSANDQRRRAGILLNPDKNYSISLVESPKTSDEEEIANIENYARKSKNRRKDATNNNDVSLDVLRFQKSKVRKASDIHGMKSNYSGKSRSSVRSSNPMSRFKSITSNYSSINSCAKRGHIITSRSQSIANNRSNYLPASKSLNPEENSKSGNLYDATRSASEPAKHNMNLIDEATHKHNSFKGRSQSAFSYRQSIKSTIQDPSLVKKSLDKALYSEETIMKELVFKKYYEEYTNYFKKKNDEETSTDYIDFTQDFMNKQLASYLDLENYDQPSRFESFRQTCLGWLCAPINEITLRIYGSKTGVSIENQTLIQHWRKYNTAIIHPLSTFRSVWDITIMILLFAQVIMVPISISMFTETDERNWIPFNLLTDTFFFLDIIVNLRTGYLLSKNGVTTELVADPTRIRLKYSEMWLYLDFASTIPFDVFVRLFVIFSTSGQDEDVNSFQIIATLGGSMKVLKTARIMKMIKFLRIAKMANYYAYLEQKFDVASEFVSIVLRIVKWTGILVLIAHLNACLQFGYADVSENARSWVKIRNLDNPNLPWSIKYRWSAFKAFSHMICIGYGQFPPIDAHDWISTMTSITVGALTFALFLGMMISTLHEAQSTKATFKRKSAEIQDYMQFRKLPADLRSRITNYFEVRYEGNTFDEMQISSQLSPLLNRVIQSFTKTWLLKTDYSLVRVEVVRMLFLRQKTKMTQITCRSQ